MLSKEVWKLLILKNEISDSQSEENRFYQQLERLKLIVQSEYFSGLGGIYLVDFKNNILKDPDELFSAPYWGKDDIMKKLSDYFPRLDKLKAKVLPGFSFTFLLFKKLNEKFVIVLRRGEISSVKINDLHFCRELAITINVDPLYSLNQGSPNFSHPNVNKIRNNVPLLTDHFELEAFYKQISQLSEDLTELLGGEKETAFSRKDIINIITNSVLSLLFKDISAFTYIPNISFLKGEKEISAGCFIVPTFASEIELDDERKESLFLLAQRWFTVNTIADYAKQAKEEVLRHARKAAASSILSRNLSHLHGSTIIAPLTYPQAIRELALNNEAGEHQDAIKYETPSGEKIFFSMLPESVDVAVSVYLAYLRSRMDLLADVPTGTPVLETVRNVFDIFDYFREQIHILVKGVTGNKKNLVINIQKAKNVTVSIPNDSLGVQCCYLILENLIRNSAKHGNGKEVKINIDCDENEAYPDYYRVNIFDAGDDKAAKIDKIVQVQNERINKQIVDDSGEPIKGSWGMMEMKIAAAYLRKVSLSDIDMPQSPPLIEAIKRDKYLGYSYYLLRPKLVLLVADNIEIPAAWGKAGIQVMSKNDFKQSVNLFKHELVVVDTDEIQIILKSNMPQRIVSISTSALRKLISKTKSVPTEFIERIWELFYSSEIFNRDFNSFNVCFFENEKLQNVVKLGKNNLRMHYSYYYHKCNFPNDSLLCEAYGSQHPAFKLIDKLKIEDTGLSYSEKCKLIESMTCTIGIIDERIQKFADAAYIGAVSNCSTNREIFERVGISVFSKEYDLNSVLFTQELISKIKSCILGWKGSLNFIIIHIGILEKLLGLNQCSDLQKKDKLGEFLLEIAKSGPAKVVIISGRGQPENLSEGTPFAHYSNISQYTTDRLSKYHLTQLLFATRA